MKDKATKKNVLVISALAVILLVAVTFFAFTSLVWKSYVSEKELFAYVKERDNGLMKEQKKDDVRFVVYYKPSDLLTAQDKHSNVIQQNKTVYDNYYYFILNLSQSGQELEATLLTNSDFGKAIQKLAFGMREHISIITSEQDTVALAEYMFPRMYGSTGSTSFICAFEKKDIEKSKNFDLVFYNPQIVESPVKFSFITKDIKNTPRIKF